MDHFYSNEYVLVADLPVEGVRTIHSRFGDWFAWLNMAPVVWLNRQSISGHGGMNQVLVRHHLNIPVSCSRY